MSAAVVVAQLERVWPLLQDRSPKQQNVAAVFEESPDGRAQLEAFLTQAPPAWRAFVEPRLPKIREVPIRYVGILGNLNEKRVLTAAARNEDELLDGLIPWFVEKLLNVAGMCPFVLGVRDPIRVAVEHRLAELQPTAGPDGKLDVPPLLAKLRESYGVQSGPAGLPPQEAPASVDLMNPTALWGGRYIAHERISYTSERLVEDAHRFQSGVAKAWLTKDRRRLDQMRAAQRIPLVFEAMPTGVLRVTGVLPSGEMPHIDFDVDEWVEDALD